MHKKNKNKVARMVSMVLRRRALDDWYMDPIGNEMFCGGGICAVFGFFKPSPPEKVKLTISIRKIPGSIKVYFCDGYITTNGSPWDWTILTRAQSVIREKLGRIPASCYVRCVEVKPSKSK